ncbi:hypothetical protein [Ottowia sp.]|uniref:hypothetical protein n=1 Tax=Ottowia sp. TaxID=1898956 RepID=UPI00260D43C3|nr:hypothetical protein [Ottowia sp.]
MQFDNITLLDDILRQEYISARRFIYTVIAEPILQATQIKIPNTNEFPRDRGLRSGFDLQRFGELCGNREWFHSYHKITIHAENYLVHHIAPNTCIVGYEMPPWLTSTLDAHSIPWINIRLSPIRFGRDLYLVITDSLGEIPARVSEFLVKEEEIRLEAGLVRASILHNAPPKTNIENSKGRMIFIGQTSSDASIVSTHGSLLDVSSYKDAIIKLVGDRELLHKPHPYDRSWAKFERRRLQEILGKSVKSINDNIYKILSEGGDSSIMAISSGVTQEAPFFGVPSITLYHPVCDISSPSSAHVRFIDFASPRFWAAIFDTQRKLNTNAIKLNLEQENFMRRLHNAYWGYDEYLIQNNKFWNKVITHGAKEIMRKAFGRLLIF